jgi:photosystem II stability/assembly factor-like uncharacterized protein
VLTTNDSGNAWEFVDSGHPNMAGEAVGRMLSTRGGNGLLLAGTESGRILIHEVGQAGWDVVLDGGWGSISSIAKDRDSRIIIVGTRQGVLFRSIDSGRTFDRLGRINNQFLIANLAIDKADPNRMYACVYGAGGYTVWRSDTLGDSWEQVNGEGLPRSGISHILTLSNSNTVWASAAEGMFQSSDGGDTWIRDEVGAPLAEIAQLAISPVVSAPVYAAVGGSVLRNRTGDLVEWDFGKGIHAERVRTLLPDPSDARIAYAGVLILGEWSVYITTDGGLNWRQTTTPTIQPVPPDTVSLAAATSTNSSTVLYAGTLGCGLLRSFDRGMSWDTYGRARCDDIKEGEPRDVTHLAVAPGNSEVVLIASGSRLYRSTDGGRSVTPEVLQLDVPINDIEADKNELGRFYVAAGLRGVLQSFDNGSTWNIVDGVPWGSTIVTLVRSIPGRPGAIIVGSSNGSLWRTYDGGRNWHSIQEGLTSSSLSSIAVSQGLGEQVIVGLGREGIARFVPNPMYLPVRTW